MVVYENKSQKEIFVKVDVQTSFFTKINQRNNKYKIDRLCCITQLFLYLYLIIIRLKYF